MTIGLKEAINEDFLGNHINTLRYLARSLEQHKVNVFKPVGGHAVAITPKSRNRYSAFALAGEVYISSGIRGGVFDDKYRLALPRRVYTRDHMKYVADMIGSVYHGKIMKLRLLNRPQSFFNFFAKFQKVR
jgi:tryptophanase